MAFEIINLLTYLLPCFPDTRKFTDSVPVFPAVSIADLTRSCLYHHLPIIGWHDGIAVGRWTCISMSWVQCPPGQDCSSNLGQVVHSYVPLLPTRITWYRSKDGNILQLGRWPQTSRKVTAVYRRDDLKSPAGWLRVHRDQFQSPDINKFLATPPLVGF